MAKSHLRTITLLIPFTLLILLTACAGDVNSRLLSAAKKGDVAKVKELLDEGADVKSEDKDGKTAFASAREKDHTEVVAVLREAASSRLLVAVREGESENAIELLEVGADVNARNENGNAALMIAIENGHENIVQTLLDQGADVDTIVSDNITALIHSLHNGYTDIVKMLLDHGADVNAVDADGNGALLIAEANDYADLTQILKDVGTACYPKQVVEDFSVRWTNTDIQAYDQNNRRVFSLGEKYEKRPRKKKPFFEAEFLALVGGYLSLRVSTFDSPTKFLTFDLSQPGSSISLKDLFSEEDLLSAFLADPVIDDHLSQLEAKEDEFDTLDSLFSLLSSKLDAMTVRNSYGIPYDLDRLFAFYGYEGGKVSIRLGGLHGKEATSANPAQLGIVLDPPNSLLAALRDSSESKSGFLLNDRLELSEDCVTRF